MKKIFYTFLVTLLFSVSAYADSINLEPNNTLDSAHKLTNNSYIYSSLDNSNDVDYFFFNVDGKVNSNITLDSPIDTDYDIALYNEKYEILSKSSSSNNIQDKISTELTTGKYYIKVYSSFKHFSNKDYILYLSVEDIYGYNFKKNSYDESTKINTSQDTAITINKDQTIRSSLINFNQSNYYKFYLDNYTDILITFTSPLDRNYSVILFNNRGTQIEQLKNNIIKIDKLEPGNYFLKVFSPNLKYSTELYTLNFNKLPQNKSINEKLPSPLLIYSGIFDPEYTTDDFKKIISTTNNSEFILTDNDTGYNFYFDNNNTEHDIVKMSDINNLTIDKIDTDGMLNEIIKDYTNFYGFKVYNLNKYSEKIVKTINTILDVDSNSKLWISLPHVSFHSLTNKNIDIFKLILLKNLKAKLDSINPDIWENNIQGYYYSGEDIISYYTFFNPENPVNFENPKVETMSSLSNTIHKDYNKKFIWIPYFTQKNDLYKYNQFLLTRIGFIANQTNIFDYIYIQPGAYFNPGRDVNKLDIVKDCIQHNVVFDYDKNIIGGSKISNTKIGFEFEVDKNYSLPEKSKIVKEYITKFSNIDTPFAIYSGNRDELIDFTINQVKVFYENSNKKE